MDTIHSKATKESLIADIKRRQEDKIIEESNAKLLIKLIENAEDLNEAINIAALGTTYKRTGFHFDKRLEKMGSDIKYFKKNEQLSFVGESTKSPITHKLIIGDNYDALQNLLIEYKGKIDVIYIDPPYGKDSMGEFAETNYDNAITRDNLLSMLYNRLILAKELMSDDGVIFCSIDDRNQAYVKCLFDEIFFEKNFIENFIWEKNPNPTFLNKYSRSTSEYILCYAKEKGLKGIESLDGGVVESSETDAPLQNKGNPNRKIRIRSKMASFRFADCIIKAGDYGLVKINEDVVIKNSTNVNDFVIEGTFRMTEETMYERMNNGAQLIFKSKKMAPRLSYEANRTNTAPLKSLESKKFGSTQIGNNNLEEILSRGIFQYPKPVVLLKKIIKFIPDNDNAIILDFFAGSGTTGQAVLELNKEDGGNRQFILCTNNEKTETTPNGIAIDVTSKRLKRVMTGKCYDGTSDFDWIKKNEPLGGSLDVYDIAQVFNYERGKGKSAFDVIDETLYGKEKFTNANDKIKWVCENFERTQKYLEEK
ncbi:MAG: site-specific DNA-methyltransferase [Lachnospiraceae bacterium]|nr:site-specific DNA-methyltransferase [Lachnospiraceae bacterium]